MKRMLWKRLFAALLAVCLMVATTATGAFALGTRTKSVTRIAENTAASAVLYGIRNIKLLLR